MVWLDAIEVQTREHSNGLKPQSATQVDGNNVKPFVSQLFAD